MTHPRTHTQPQTYVPSSFLRILVLGEGTREGHDEQTAVADVKTSTGGAEPAPMRGLELAGRRQLWGDEPPQPLLPLLQFASHILEIALFQCPFPATTDPAKTAPVELAQSERQEMTGGGGKGVGGKGVGAAVVDAVVSVFQVLIGLGCLDKTRSDEIG